MLFRIRLFSLFRLIVLLCSSTILSLENVCSPLQLVTMTVKKEMLKSVPAFVKEDCKYTLNG